MRAFRIGLYREHLDEASFLYGHCRALRRDPQIPWPALAGFEERLEAHLDALVVGEDLALAVANTQALDGDAGELFAALSVFCRQRLPHLLSGVLQGLDETDRARLTAVTDALKYALPDQWSGFVTQAMARRDARLTPLLAVVCGYRRIPTVGLLPALLAQAPPTALRPLLWAAGRTREAGLAAAVRPFYAAPQAAIGTAALRAGLRLQDPDALHCIRTLSGTGDCPPLLLGLAGGRGAVPLLLERLRRCEADRDALTALGFLGDPAAIPALTERLDPHPLAAAAAEALHLITGAPLFEDLFVPEPIAEDELFEHELATYRQTGEGPRRGDGKPFGTSVRRLCRNRDRWAAWLQEHAGRLTAHRRYRCGHPDGPAVLLAALAADTCPAAWRGQIAEELCVRYGVDLPFEVDLPVAAQRRVLEAAAHAVREAASRVEPGHWSMFGRPLTTEGP